MQYFIDTRVFMYKKVDAEFGEIVYYVEDGTYYLGVNYSRIKYYFYENE